MSVVCSPAPNHHTVSMTADSTMRGSDTGEIMVESERSVSAPRVEPGRDVYMTPYERLTYDLSNDKKAVREVMLGKRIGFYRIRGELGSGNFSQVKLGVHILTREKVAIKILDKTKLDAKTQRLLSREMVSMERLHHPNIVRLYEVVETLAKLYLIIEYASEGELFTRISNEGRIQEPEARHIFSQIVAAVCHMHNKNIIHRDLKAENIYFSGARTVKVGDFGFSTRVTHPGQPLNTFCGSPPYAAPELFRDDSYSGPMVDMWAMGIILYFIVSGVLPFRAETVGKLKKCILDGQYTIPQYLTESCKELITALLSPEWCDRPVASQVITYAWLEGEELADELEPFGLYTPPPDPVWDNVSSQDESYDSPVSIRRHQNGDVVNQQTPRAESSSSVRDVTDRTLSPSRDRHDRDKLRRSSRTVGSAGEVFPLVTFNNKSRTSSESGAGAHRSPGHIDRRHSDNLLVTSPSYKHSSSSKQPQSPERAQAGPGRSGRPGSSGHVRAGPGRPGTPHAFAKNRIRPQNDIIKPSSGYDVDHFSKINSIEAVDSGVVNDIESTEGPHSSSRPPSSPNHRKSLSKTGKTRSKAGRRKDSRFVEDELEARKICQELGITDSHLSQAGAKGLRSSVTGTYHIILHRLQKKRNEVDNPVSTRGSLGQATTSSGRTSRGTSEKPKNGTKESTPKKPSSAAPRNHKQSKMCAIL